MALLTADSNCGVLTEPETCDCQQRASWGKYESLCSNKVKKKCKSFLKKEVFIHVWPATLPDTGEMEDTISW